MRGGVYYALMPMQSDPSGSVQQGRRPVVVVSSEIGCKTASVVMVCPLTTKHKKLSCNVDINFTNGMGVSSQVLCNQIQTVPVSALSRCYYTLSDDEMHAVDTAICISLGIVDYMKKLENGERV